MTDLQLVLQPSKTVYFKMELIANDYITKEQLQGDLLDIGMTISAQSDIRRIANATMHIHDVKKLAGNYFGKWLGQMVYLNYGIYDPSIKDIKWFLLGSFLFTSSSYQVDISNRTLSISLGDMMVSMTEQRGSQMGFQLLYPAGSAINQALEATIARFSEYKKTDICEFPEGPVPYDIQPAAGNYPLAALKELVGLYSWYEHFYSKDGVYTVKPIPTTMAESVVMKANDMQKIVISEDGSVSYRQVKNATEIWGKSITPNYTSLNCVSQDGVYRLQLSSTFQTYEYGSLIAFRADRNSGNGQKVKINDLQAYPIVVENGAGAERPIALGEIVPGILYVLKYKSQKFYLQGQAQIHVMCMEYNQMPSDGQIEGLRAFHNCQDIKIVVSPDSPYACDQIGVIKQVLKDGDYANIYTTELGFERASYENWQKTRLQDAITIQALFVPWLDVNQKVEYRSIATNEVHQYIIRQIEVKPLTGTMSVRMVRFFPLYPWTDGEPVSQKYLGSFILGSTSLGQ